MRTTMLEYIYYGHNTVYDPISRVRKRVINDQQHYRQTTYRRIIPGKIIENKKYNIYVLLDFYVYKRRR